MEGLRTLKKVQQNPTCEYNFHPIPFLAALLQGNAW
jgi:hypothetical protein